MMRNVFVLQAYRDRNLQFAFIADEKDTTETVQAAWTYALKHTAKSLTEPDHEAAIAMMLDRHPSWEQVRLYPHPINYKDETADKDKPEGKWNLP